MGTPSAPAVRFPDVVGRSLLGVEYSLPAQLPAERTLVIIAFEQWQQARVDRWIERAVEAGVPATIRGAAAPLPLAVLELPVLSSLWRPARRFIDGGMTAGIRDPDVLARTITVYTNLEAFRDALRIDGSGEVHALLVARDGTILGRASGEPATGWPSISRSMAVADA